MPSSSAIDAHSKSFIKEQVQQGRHTSASEVVRDGLHVLEEREQLRATELEVLRAALQQCSDSRPGIPADKVFARLEAKYQQMAGERSDA